MANLNFLPRFSAVSTMAALTCCASLACASDEGKEKEKPEPPREKPNIIVMLVDDLGYSDLGCYGSEIPTPNIDRIAANGIRYRSFYNNARSSPTRASLLTGMYPHQVGVGRLGEEPGYPAYQGWLNSNNVLIPEAIKEAGYFSVMTGKWHLGRKEGLSPIKRGFDRSLDGASGGFYFSTDKSAGLKVFMNDEGLPLNSPKLPAEWYSTDLWVDYGLQYIDEAVSKGEPFFWYLAHNGAHFPLQAPAATIAKHRGKYTEGFDAVRNRRYQKQVNMGLFSSTDPLTPRNPKAPADWDKLTAAQRDQYDLRMAIYAAVIDEIDKNTGKILDYLEQKGILDNTVIIILSDNGGNAESGVPGRWIGDDPGGANSDVWLGTPWADVANTPYFLYKHHGHQGGCSTPLIISYPAGIAKSMNGTIDKENYGHLIDLMPTVIELAGSKYPTRREGIIPPPLEGISLVPSFSGKKLQRTNPIIVEHEGNKMLREGDWKIVQENKEPLWQLYNLRSDPTEMHDLSATNPAKTAEMVTKYGIMAAHIGVEPQIEFPVGIWYTPTYEYGK